jgi:proton-dependent oligopeptide transporter, POT family
MSLDAAHGAVIATAERGHPKGLAVLFFAEMWERFSYYGMRALLVLYMTKSALAYGDQRAYAVYGSYTALVYMTPLFGGMLADRLLGYRRAVTVGAVLMALGHFTMAIQAEQAFYLALALLICGNGLFKPNISTIVGRLYAPGDPRRDGGFTLFYMGINLGAGLAPLVCGFVGETYGWHWGFGIAGVGMLLGLWVFQRGRATLGDVAEPPDLQRLREPIVAGLSREHAVYAGAALAVLVAWQLVQRSAAVGWLLSGVGACAVAGIVGYMLARCDKMERDRLLVALVLTGFGMVFWAFFEQAGSSINLFTDRNVDRTLLGIELKTSLFQAVNPGFILMLGPLFSMLWVSLARRGQEPSTAAKFGAGILQLGLGFAALYVGALGAGPDGIVGLGWLLLGYLLHTTGELCLSPVGLSMITKLSPARIGGLMMGTWFLSTAFSQYVGGMIAALTGVSGDVAGESALPSAAERVMVYGDVFGGLAAIACVTGLVLLALAPTLARRTHGVH